MTMQASPIGIIAGEGQFPCLVVQGALSRGHNVVAVGIIGTTWPSLEARVDAMLWVRLGQFGKMLSFLHGYKVQEIVFAGSINKARAMHIRPDFKALKVLYKARNFNDDAIFQTVAGFLEGEGLKIVSPLKYVPDLATPQGILSKRRPNRLERKDIQFGWPIAHELGSLDIGQCLVVRRQTVVAVEAMEGTNATIQRAGKLMGRGCVILKVFKPGQKESIDQPSVGLTTIETMLEAGATCLVAEAHKSLFFDRKESLELADRSGICVIGYNAENKGF